MKIDCNEDKYAVCGLAPTRKPTKLPTRKPTKLPTPKPTHKPTTYTYLPGIFPQEINCHDSPCNIVIQVHPPVYTNIIPPPTVVAPSGSTSELTLDERIVIAGGGGIHKNSNKFILLFKQINLILI